MTRHLRRITWAHVSLLAALALVAQSEWQLARMVGWPAWIAWAAPIALDAYVLAAVRARRDLGPSVLVSAASVVASHALAHQYPDPADVPWWLVGTASAVPLLVTWRVHHLPTTPHQEQTCPTSPAPNAATDRSPSTSPGRPERMQGSPSSTTGPRTFSTGTTPTSQRSSSTPSSLRSSGGAVSAPSPSTGPNRREVAEKLIAGGLPIPSIGAIERAYNVPTHIARRARTDALTALETP